MYKCSCNCIITAQVIYDFFIYVTVTTCRWATGKVLASSGCVIGRETMHIILYYTLYDHEILTVYTYSTYVHNIPSENCLFCLKTQKGFTMCNPKIFILCKTIPFPAHSCTSHQVCMHTSIRMYLAHMQLHVV